MNATSASVERVPKCVFNSEIYRFLKKRPTYPSNPILPYGQYFGLSNSKNMYVVEKRNLFFYHNRPKTYATLFDVI